MPPGLHAEVPDMRGLYPRFVCVLLPVGLPVEPRYHETLQRNSGLLEGTLHLRSPTDRVDVERPAAICRVRIVQQIEPNLRHRRERAAPTNAIKVPDCAAVQRIDRDGPTLRPLTRAAFLFSHPNH